MPKDYKNRSYTKKPSRGNKSNKSRFNRFDGLLILAFIVVASLFGVSFLNPDSPDTKISLDTLLSTNNISDAKNAELKIKKQLQNKNIQALAAKAQAKIKQKADSPSKQDKIPKEPHFDFYTILPKLEVVIPEYEIKTRIREEQTGTLKKGGRYVMQAGSFRDFLEAKKLHVKLTAFGVESHIERAMVGKVVWHRIKIGPFSGLSSIMAIKTRLRNNGIDTLVLEFKG
ncbi:MAG: SPOR domain-containing protein [Methylococcales bacterium]|nr:SPOR domain-containing protein [Methylococcales bacterium]